MNSPAANRAPKPVCRRGSTRKPPVVPKVNDTGCQ